ncbi:hypothetical protein ATO12_19350 [Aquimarina atlantica]|uniref:Uncharacterized protein n=1 Tax=Aquimarina atlantica TaxID=1317122 RepID=A0A023BTA1_9FLAO|nr:hypothetical protein [Aquimarina atlantica]EZH73164.1 hypothetical protein ATO12_19350 [Aquimarina atlantica]
MSVSFKLAARKNPGDALVINKDIRVTTVLKEVTLAFIKQIKIRDRSNIALNPMFQFRKKEHLNI